MRDYVVIADALHGFAAVRCATVETFFGGPTVTIEQLITRRKEFLKVPFMGTKRFDTLLDAFVE